MPGSGVLGIKAWRRAVLDGVTPNGITPLDIADQLDNDARLVKDNLSALRAMVRGNGEQIAVLNDIEMFGLLGAYYASKIRAACDLALFDANEDVALRDSAVSHLEDALVYWQAYASKYAQQYKERVLYNRVGWVDRTALISHVEADIEMAREWRPGSLISDEPTHPANPRAD
jgi:hypothetical protein